MRMETIGFLGGDARMAYLARLLAADGYAVRSWALADAPNEGTPSEAAAAERVILPVPLAKEGKLHGTSLPLEELWQRLSAKQRIYAGAVPRSAWTAIQRLGLRVTDYYTDEALTVANAAVTAEGAVQTAMERLSVTLRGTPCLVIGFGRIGKLLAHDLAALGADVSVSARRFDDFAWIDALGYRALHTERLNGKLGGFRAIFNTVPHPVLDAPLLAQLRRDCVVVELASLPGVDAEATGKLAYIKANGLPGKTAPETAARALRQTLYRIWEEET